MIPNASGTQAHFSATQQLFSSSSDPKKQTCISQDVFFQKNTYFLSKMWEARIVPPVKIENLFYRLSMNNRG